MSRRTRKSDGPTAKPVEQIELSTRSPKKRIIIAAVLLVLGLGLLGYALFSGASKEKGWMEIEANAATAESSAFEMTFLYDLGASGNSPTTEYKNISKFYTELCSQTYKVFNTARGYEGVINPYYINRHLNEVITVDPVLYDALETATGAGNRFLFAAPFYTEYKNMFSDTQDATAALLDPFKSQEVAKSFKELSVYTSDENHIKLELMEYNKIKLCVSKEYENYAASHGIFDFIDFYWATNAFVVDHIADEMTAKGFTNGVISSFDGFKRVMDERSTGYSNNLYCRYQGNLYEAARLDFVGKSSMVSLRSFRTSAREEIYYAYKTGEERHAYIDVNDGLCKNSTDVFVAVSKDKRCAEVLMAVMPIYINDTFDASAVTALATDGVNSVFFEGTDIKYTGDTVKFSSIYKEGAVSFKPVKIG